MTEDQKLAALEAEAAELRKKDDLTDTDLDRVEEIAKEYDERKAFLKRRQESSDRLKAMTAPLPDQKLEAQVSTGEVAKSLGEHFVKSLNGRSLLAPGTIAAPVYKAADDVQMVGGSGMDAPYGPLLTEVDRSFVMPKRERLVIADLMGAGTLGDKTALTYPVFGALEGGTEFVAEAGQKPRLHVSDPTWVTDALGEVAGYFTLSDDMAEDLPYVVSEINSTAIYDLQSNEERSLLRGDGASPNLRGILNRDGVQVATQGADAIQDAIFKSLTRVEQATEFAADGIVINPADYEALRLAKDANGQYFGGGFFAGQYGAGDLMVNPLIWGRKTVVTTAVDKGTVVVGAWKRGAQVFRKGGLRVESTNSHNDDFTNDRITVRIRERLGLQVKYPAAFVKLTLATD